MKSEIKDAKLSIKETEVVVNGTVTYAIRCAYRNSSEEKWQTSATVDRTSNDAISLRTSLSERIAGAVIPPIGNCDATMKQYFTSEQIIASLETDMTNFLKLCIRHPEIRDDEEFKAFLVYSVLEWNIKYMNKEKDLNADRQLALAQKGMQDMNPFASKEDESQLDISEDRLRILSLRKYLDSATEQLGNLIGRVVADLGRTDAATEGALTGLTSMVPGGTESARALDFNTILETLYSLQLTGTNYTLAGKVVKSGEANIERKMRGMLALYSEARRCERWISAAKVALDEEELLELLLKHALDSVAGHSWSVKQRKEHEAEASNADTSMLPAALVRTYYETAAKAHSTDADHFAASAKAQELSIKRDAAELRALRDVDYVSKSIAEAMRQMIYRFIEAESIRFKSYSSAMKEMARLTEPQIDETRKGGLLTMICAPAKELNSETL